MELDAVTCDTLVAMINVKGDANESRVVTLNQMRTNAAVVTRVDFLDVTLEERRAIRAIQNGKIGTLKADVLELLMRRGLLKYDGQSLVLTATGSQMDDGSAANSELTTCKAANMAPYAIGTALHSRVPSTGTRIPALPRSKRQSAY